MGWPSGCCSSSSGCSGRDDRPSQSFPDHVDALHRGDPHHVRRPAQPLPRAADRAGDHRHLPRALASHLLALRPRGRRLSVLRGAVARSAARHHLSARRGRHEPPHGAPHLHHHLRGGVGVVDGQGAQPGVLRAPPHPGERRVRRVRVPRPLRPLPLLRDRGASDVSPHRHLGLLRRGASAGHLRVGVPTHRSGDEGIRGDEADPLPPLRVGLHPRRNPRPLRLRGLVLLLPAGAGAGPLFAAAAVLGVPGLLRGLRHPRRHLAAPHVVARRPRVRAHRRLHAARRGAHEARRLRRGAPGHGPLARRHASVDVAGRDDRVREHRLRRAVRDGPGRSQVRDRLLLGLPHGGGDARRRHPHRERPQRLGVPDVRPWDHDRPLLRPRRPSLREGALARDLPHGRLRQHDAGDRHRLHDRRPVLAGPAGDGRLRGGVPHLPRGLAVAVPVVALPGGDRRVPHVDLRPAGDQADLLGSALDRSPLSRPARRAGPGVGGAGDPGLRADPLRGRPGHRPRPRRHRHGAPPDAPGGAAMRAFSLEGGLLVLMLIVFVGGLFGRRDDSRRVGVVSVLGLVALFYWSLRLGPGASYWGGAYVVDELALFAKRLFLGATVIGILGSLTLRAPAFARRATEYYLLMLSSLLGMVVLASARDLILLFVAFELMSIPLYALAGFQKRDGEAVEAALKFFLVGTVSAALIAYGLSFVYGVTRTTLISGIGPGLAGGSPLLILGLVITLAGLGFKIAAFPFHMWVPDTYEAANAPFVEWLSVAPKGCGFIVILRL